MMRRRRAIHLSTLLLLAALAAACSSAGGLPGDLDAGAATPGDGGAVRADGGGTAGGACVNVADCPRGYGCLSGRCVNAGQYECRNDLAPIVQVEPATLDFGSIRVGVPVDKTLRIRNLGSCNLQITQVSFAPGTTTEFGCEECSPRGTYPINLVPFDSKTIVVTYTANDATPDSSSLRIVTTDPQFSLIDVPLKSTVKDAARIYVDPAVLDFGYVPVGQRKTLPFQITNAGGQTPLLVRSIENLPLGSPNYLIATTATGTDGGLAYLNSGTPPVPMTVNITYQPTNLATHNEAIRITSDDRMTPRVDVQVRGYSVTPPSIRVTPTLVNFGTVAAGTRQQIPVTIENNGGADLQVQLAFAPLSSTAFSYNPTGLAAIPGGQRATLYLEYLPTATGSAQAILNITHNAQGTPSPVAVSMAGSGVPSTGDDVLALEMTFENGDDSVFGSDLRDVDLHYRSPFFQDCSKDQANRTNSVTCMWGNFGTPQWIGIGPKQEPERVVHTNPGSMTGDFAVELLYVEDCANLPTGLLSSLTGIGLDIILQYLAGGVIPAGTGGSIATAILNNCFDHSATTAQVKAYVNGQLQTSRSVRLGARGDLVPVFTVHRENGRFTLQ